MPNHCFNQISLKGSKADIASLKEFVAGEIEGERVPFDFNKIVPMPKELDIGDAEYAPKPGSPQYKLQRDNTKNFGYPSWYEWRTANWGTKWNSYDSDEAWKGNKISFLTAWAPPRPVLEALAALFPAVTITNNYQIEGEECHEEVYNR